MAYSYIIRLTNKMLQARRNGDIVEAKILADQIAELQYIW